MMPVAPKNITIQLMTTSGCHLCEQALQMVNYITSNVPELGRQVQLELVEISLDDRLVDEYGIRIPVLRNKMLEETSSELSWPFELEALQRWLEERI